MSASEKKALTLSKVQKRPKKAATVVHNPQIQVNVSTRRMSVALRERSVSTAAEEMSNKEEIKDKTEEESTSEQPKPANGDFSAGALMQNNSEEPGTEDEGDEAEEVEHEDYNDDPEEEEELRNKAIFVLLQAYTRQLQKNN